MYRTLIVIIVSLILALSLYSTMAISELAEVHNDKLYVTCKGGNYVQVINVSTGAVDRMIQVESQPYLITISTDGTRAMVVNYDNGTISVIDTVNDAVTNTFKVERGPTGVAFSNDSSRAYVSNAYGFQISIYDVTTGDRIVTMPAVQPAGIATGGDGLMYAVDPGSNQVLIIDPAAGLIVATIPAGGSFNGIAIVPGGPALIASTTNGNLSFVDLASRNVTATVSTGNGPYGIAVSPDNQTAYVTNMNGNTLAVLDLSDHAVAGTVTVGKMPAGVALSEDGQRAYVANSGGDTISVIDTATLKVNRTIATGKTPYGVAYIPNTTLVDVQPTHTPLFGSGNAMLNMGLIALVLLLVAIAGAFSYRRVMK
jgi:YVTN family beta-propeller protein